MDETKELIREAQNGNTEAMEKLVVQNSGLIWSIVRKFLGRGYEAEDLFQTGAIGLIKCIEKFDMDFDVKLSTYAVPMIMGEIRRFLRDDGMLKVSRPLKETAARAKYTREKMINKNGTEPTVTELAKEMDIEPEQLVEAIDASKEVESIFKTVYQTDGSPVYLIDRLSTGKDEDLTDLITLRQLLKELEPKERRLIFLRYFKDKTQSETAGEIGISQVQVSRLEKKILNRIREGFGA